ncbi:MAG: hypothetical protein R3E98_07770 [Gemmatimonadota bacterium]|nr:PD40 domain-containing protein [Gemmatimonadota bacterium]
MRLRLLPALPIAVLLTLAAGPLTDRALAQEEFPNVRLGLVYDPNAERPGLALPPLSARFGGEAVAAGVGAILARDLRYSDRFEIIDSLPPDMMEDGTVNYGLWDRFGATWLLDGQVEGVGDGFTLALELHDVVYRESKQRARFPLPPQDSDDFRMAVHAVSDAIVEWITGEPGMAASRIAFSRRDGDGNQDLWLVDSDGENMERVTRYGTITLSPTWAPDGRRLAFTSYKDGPARIYELDLVTRAEKAVPGTGDAMYLTPTYHPNGQQITFGVAGDGGGIYSYDIGRGCCLQRLTDARRYDDISPSYSPDGGRLAFMTSRLAGESAPQIYIMPSGGGDGDLLSPFDVRERGYYTSPDWSPIGDRVVFHGRIERGRYQILVAEVGRGRARSLIQLTREGQNEDPSWAPDGRHIVFVGERSNGVGLWVVDAVTGRTRLLVPNIRARAPEWSPTLAEARGNILRN